MSALTDKQIKFTHMIGQLIQFAYQRGYGLTFGCARCAKEGHHRKQSLHYAGLAVDFNLWVRGPDGKLRWATRTEDHQDLGQFWETIGGSWGGRFQDGNHYSLEHRGML